MAGLLRPDRGRVTVLGEDPFSSIHVKERVFYVMDTVNIPPHLSIYDYFLHLSRIYGFNPSAIKESFQSLDLWTARERKVKQLSAGMKQKAQLAIALCARADLVVADEPASNMDPVARMQLYDTIRKINRENGTTFFISSHILAELEKVITGVIIISHGRKLAQSGMKEAAAEASRRHGGDSVRISVSDTAAASKVVPVVGIEGDAVIVRTEGGSLGSIISRLEAEGISVLSVERSHFDLGEVFTEAVSNERGN